MPNNCDGISLFSIMFLVFQLRTLQLTTKNQGVNETHLVTRGIDALWDICGGQSFSIHLDTVNDTEQNKTPYYHAPGDVGVASSPGGIQIPVPDYIMTLDHTVDSEVVMRDDETAGQVMICF